MDSSIYVCRICLSESTNVNDFIVPCKCKGTHKYVHRECLDMWRKRNVGTDNFYVCDLCHFRYEIITKENINEEREIEYKKQVKLFIVFLIFSIFVIFLLFILILYIIYKNKTKRLFIYSSFLNYLIYTFELLIISISVSSFILYISMISIDRITLTNLGFSFIAPYIVIIYLIKNYIERSKKKIRRLIWSKQSTDEEVVKDFSPDGPI